MDVQKSMTNICSTIKLMSSDGQIFETDTGSVKCMEAVMTMLSAVGGNEPNDLAPIPLPNVRSHILRKLLTYANYHKNDRQQRSSANNRPNARCAVGVAAGGMSEHISHWDSEFLNVPKSELFEIIAGANYLEMGGLMNVACQTVANMLKCRTPDEMRTIFNIPNDFVEHNAHHARNFDDTSDEDEQHQQQLQQQQQQQQQHIDVGNAAAVAAASAAAVAEHRQQQYQRNRTLARANVINNRNRNQRLMSLTRELDQQHLNLLRRLSIDQAAHHQHYGMGMRRLEEMHEHQQQQQQRRQRHEQQQQQQLMQQHRNQQQRHQQQQQQQHMRTPYGHQNRRFLRHLAANNNNSNNNHNELHIFVDNTNTNNYHYNFDNANDNDNLGNQAQQQQRRNNRNRYRRPRNQQNRNALL